MLIFNISKMISKSLDKILFFFRYQYQIFYRILLLLFSMTLIVVSLPKTVRFNYQYVKGLPWAYPDLIAPFDFAILKTSDELAKEKILTLSQTVPYYSFSKKVTDSMGIQMQKAFEQKWALKYRDQKQRLKASTFDVIKRLFEHTTSRGIVSAADLRSDKSEFNILFGNSANLASRQSIFTLQTAYEYYQAELERINYIDKNLALDVLQNNLFFNLFYSKEITSKEEDRMLNQISLTQGLVQNGERIIAKGELVSASKFQILYSLENEFNKQFGGSSKFINLLFGQALLVLLSFGLLIIFIQYFNPQIINDTRQILLILSALLIVILPLSLIIHSASEYILLFPIAILPLVLRPFFEEKVTLMIHLIAVLIISSFVPSGFQFVFLQMIAGIIAVVGVKNMHKRGQIFVTSFMIFLGYIIGYFMLVLVMEGNLEKFSIFSRKFSFRLVFFSFNLFVRENVFSINRY